MAFWIQLVVFTMFACGGYLATRFADWCTREWPRYKNLPVRSEPNWIVALALALATGFIGISYVGRGATPAGIAMLTLVCLTLAFACYADLRVGRLPAVIMLPVLAIVLGVDVIAHDFVSIVAALLVTTPFAIAASVTKARSLSWSDVQLVALGALVLDVTLGLLALAAACFLAVGVAYARKRVKEPVAFAPYLTATIELALLLPTTVR